MTTKNKLIEVVKAELHYLAVSADFRSGEVRDGELEDVAVNQASRDAYEVGYRVMVKVLKEVQKLPDSSQEDLQEGPA